MVILAEMVRRAMEKFKGPALGRHQEASATSGREDSVRPATGRQTPPGQEGCCGVGSIQVLGKQGGFKSRELTCLVSS